MLVNKQVLADPAGLGPEVKVWARLKDGTPLVTAAKRGDGQLDLLPRHRQLGLVEPAAVGPVRGDAAPHRQPRRARAARRRRWSATARAPTSDAPAAAEVLAPLQVLDGFGLLKNPPPTTQAIAAAKIADARPSAENPPGYYGPAGAPRALNLMTPKSLLKPLPGDAARASSAASTRATPPSRSSRSCSTIALALLFADIVAVLLLQAGGLAVRPPRRRAGAAVAGRLRRRRGCGCLMLPAPPAPRRHAPARRGRQSRADDARAIQATAKVTFGYVLSGDAATDEASRQGLDRPRQVPDRAHGGGAGRAVRRQHPRPTRSPSSRSSTGRCWPTRGRCPRPTLAKIDAYMKQGGMIIFDTKDYGQGMPTGFSLRGEGGTPLQRLLGNLDIPRLEPVPEHHVLTKSFYLLRSFPGPLGRRPAVGGGRGAARQRPGPAGAPRRRRELDPDHVQRLRRRLGAAMTATSRSIRWCPAASASARWRSAPASTSSCMR